MARTESKSIQVHPRDEQAQIDLMQRFHWSLLNSQEIKTVDNHLEQRGNSIHSVTNTENYVKLVFSRDLELPNLDKIKRLEEEFFSLSYPNYPDYPTPIGCFMVVGLAILFAVVAGIIGGVTSSGGTGVLLGLIAAAGTYAAYFNLSYKPREEEANLRKEQADQKRAQTKEREQEILEAVDQFN